MRVLIADDQRTFGTALADMVCCCGHQVIGVVGSGLEAIHAYTVHHPDLVLMDYRMPKLNGGTACRHILAKDPAARVILVSAWSPLDGADQSGAICFLPKPVELNRLNATLERVVQTLPASYSALQSSISDLPTPTWNLPAPCFDSPPDIFPPTVDPISQPVTATPTSPKKTGKERRRKQQRSK